jgi:hypothetical protein
MVFRLTDNPPDYILELYNGMLVYIPCGNGSSRARKDNIQYFLDYQRHGAFYPN